MNRFISILKKELRDLFTLQLVIPLALSALLFMMLGNIMGGVMENIGNGGNGAAVAVMNLDSGDAFTDGALGSLEGAGARFAMLTPTDDDAAALDQAVEQGFDSFAVIPKGFGAGIAAGQKQDIRVVSKIKSLSMMTAIGSSDSPLPDMLNEAVSATLLADKGLTDPTFAKNPVGTANVSVVNGKSANIAPAALLSVVMNQSLFIPLVVFMVIMMSSQMIATAIVNEKSDKTLETLLAAPVPRSVVLMAKMVAAGLISLVYASVYMIGFSSYMGSMTGGAQVSGMGEIMQNLGLTLSVGQYILVGAQLFFSILIALAVSMILGTLVRDIKSVQSVVMPITVVTMIPFIVSMFMDVTALPAPLNIIMYIIPFTHTFASMNLLMLGNYGFFAFGMLYQLVFLVAAVGLATWIFSTDKIFTMSISLSRKRKGLFSRLGS